VQRFLKSIGTGTLVLATLATPIQVSCQHGPPARPSRTDTKSSVPRPGTTRPQSVDDIPCLASGSSSSGVTTDPAAPGQPHHVDLSWKAGSSPTLVKYNVRRRTPDSPWTIITTGTGTSYSDTQVQPRQEYCYLITAFTAKSSESGPSNLLNVVVPAP